MLIPRKRFEKANESTINTKKVLAKLLHNISKLLKFIRFDKLSYLENEVHKDDIVQDNIKRVSFWNQIKSSPKHEYESRRKMVLAKRDNLFKSNLKQKLFWLNKWEFIKKKKKIAHKNLFKVKQRIATARGMIKQLYLIQFLRRIYMHVKDQSGED